MSFQLIADAIPRFGLLTAGYLFQDSDPCLAFMASDLGAALRDSVRDEMGIEILSACYLGTRHLNLRKASDVQTPADLDGVKLRKPGSDAWLFLGAALGANPTPLPFSEVYLGLQTGTVDARDTPLPTVEAAKVCEVTEQITLTSHLVDGLPMVVNAQTRQLMDDGQKADMVEAAQAACDWNNERRYAEEDRLVAVFERAGLTVTTPDVDALRSHVQEVHMRSDRVADWPEGWVAQINALAN